MTDIVEEILERHGSEVLKHHGVKGMRWGHRKEQVTSAVSSHIPHLTDSQKSTAKKVAIGVGVAAVIVGGAYVAYRMHKSGFNPISSIRHGSEVSRGKVFISDYSHSNRVERAYRLQLGKELANAARARRAQADGASQVKKLLLSEHGSARISGLNPSVVSAGKLHLQTLYTKWVDVQVHPATLNVLSGALDVVK